jgi:hypothetical protein
MEKERQALPPASRFRNNCMFRDARLTQRLNKESRFLQCRKVGLKRTMLAVKRHRQSVSLLLVGVAERAKIVPFDDKPRVGDPTFKMSGRVDRMNNRETQPPAGFQDTRYFAKGQRHRINVVKRHKGDRKVRSSIIQRQRSRIGDPEIHRRVQVARGGDERRRSVKADDLMPECLQAPRKSPFAAAYVHCASARRRQKAKKLVAVVSPVAVVSGAPSPLNPLVGLSLPTISKVHEAPPALFGVFDVRFPRNPVAARTLFCPIGKAALFRASRATASVCALPPSLLSNRDANRERA